MTINAYVLAADPAWIEASVLSYYHLVDKMVVCHDRNCRGWTGAPVRSAECARILQSIDRDKKIELLINDFARLDHTPMENDTYQRQCALEVASAGADWVLMLDTDEVLPNPAAVVEMLKVAENRDIPAVEWPMRVLFRRLGDGRFLEVCAKDGADRFEYPGPIAVRPGVKFVNARRTDGPYIRPVVRGDRHSIQIAGPPQLNEHRTECDGADAIIHNSWARTPGSIRRKIASWGHHEGLKSWFFYHLRWKPAPYVWRLMSDFHPFARGLWPALKPCMTLPTGIPAAYLENLA